MIALALLLSGCSDPPHPVAAPPATPRAVPPPEALEELLPPPGVHAPEGAPHVVLVIGCTVRGDQTSLDGGPRATTPFLASLAQSGTRFLDTIASAPWTRPANTAILTGREPLTVGMTEPTAKVNQRVLPESVVTLAEVFRARGYHTVGVTANPNLDERWGFAQGFERYRDTRALGEWRGPKVQGSSIVDRLLEDVGPPDPKHPLYLQALLFDPHQPVEAPREAVARMQEPGVPLALAAYRAELRALDDAVARLDAGLRAQGYEDVLFVFVADHGEGLELPPHHGHGHGNYLYPSTVSVPWIVRGPGVPEGRVVPGMASHLDLLPTVLGLVGAPVPLDVDGRDLSPAVRGERADTGQDRVWTETWYGASNRAGLYEAERACLHDLAPGGEPQRTQRRVGGPFIELPAFVSGCFDRRADPDFERPLPLDRAQADITSRRAALEARALAGVEGEMDEASTDRLRALGYVE